MSLFAPIAGAIWKQLEGYGLDAASLFREAGIDPTLIFDANARIPVGDLDQLVCLAAERSRDPHFGLREHDFFRPAHMGALGFAWLASSSLRDALGRLSRYSAMLNPSLTIELTEDEARLTTAVDAARPCSYESIKEDSQMALLTKLCRAIAGDAFNPERVTFRQPEPADTSYHYQLFKCPVDFGTTATSLVIPVQVADKELTGSNEELANLNEHIVVKYLAHASKNDTVNRVRTAIIDNLGAGNVSENSVANILHTTPRNLHRKLQKEETSFKLLLNETRQELAEQYIRDRSLTLTEISFMLGFSEVSSFSRAYKSWTGLPPSQARTSRG